LEWTEKGKVYLAPLILLPVELAKVSKHGDVKRFYLRGSDDEPVANVTLKERLRRDFSIELPLPDLSRESLDLKGYFETVSEAISEAQEWRVHTYLNLALFSFSGLELYLDLDPETVHRSPLIRQLLTAEAVGKEGATNSMTIAEDVRVDQPEITARVPVLIAQADASQFAAVADVMEGRSMVIEGPPGTGKSQTITNIIANALYAGKRVLFVAEKKVALDVVHNRLAEAGLKPYCLRLESDSANKKQVYDELAERLALAKPSSPWREGPLTMFNELRDGLNQFADLLNTPHGPEGQSRHALLWQELQLRLEFQKAGLDFDATAVALPAAAALDRAGQETNLQVIEQLASLLNGLDQAEMEKLFAAITHLPTDGFALDALLDQAKSWKENIEMLAAMLEPLHHDAVHTLAELRQAAILCSATAERLPEPLQAEAEALLPALSSPPIAEAAQSLLNALKAEKETETSLLAHFERLTDPLPQQYLIEELVGKLQQWQFDQKGIPSKPEERSALQESLRQTVPQIERLDELLNARQGLLPLAEWSAEQLNRVQPLLTKLCSLPDWILAQRQTSLWRSDGSSVRFLLSEQQQLGKLRSELRLNQAEAEALDDQALKTAMAAMQRCHDRGLAPLLSQADAAETRIWQIKAVSTMLSDLGSELTQLLGGIDLNELSVARLQTLNLQIRGALSLGSEVLDQRGSALWETSTEDIQAAVEEEKDLLARESQLRRDGLVVPESCSAEELLQAAHELDATSFISRASGYLDGRRVRAKNLCRRVRTSTSRCDDLRAVASVVELRHRFPQGWQRQRFGVELCSEELLKIGQRLQKWKAAILSKEETNGWLEWLRHSPEASLRKVQQQFEEKVLADLNTVATSPLLEGGLGECTFEALRVRLADMNDEPVDLAEAEWGARWARAAGVREGEAMADWLKRVVDYRDRISQFPGSEWDGLLQYGLEPAQIEEVITAALETRRWIDEAAIEGLSDVISEATPEILKQAHATIEHQLVPLLDELFSSTGILTAKAQQQPLGPLLVSLMDAAKRYQLLLQGWRDAGLRMDASLLSLGMAPLDLARAHRRQVEVRECLSNFQEQAGMEVSNASAELLQQVVCWIRDLRSGQLPQAWQVPCLQQGSGNFIRYRKVQTEAVAEALASEQQSAVSFCTTSGLDLSAAQWAEGRSVEEIQQVALRQWLSEISEQRDLLQTWTRQQQLLKRVSAGDARVLVNQLLHSDLAGVHWADIYRWNVLRQRLQHMNGGRLVMQQQQGADQAARRDRFHQLEDELRTLDQQHVACAIHRNLEDLPRGKSQGKKSDFTELALIQNEVLKQKRHRPLRHLFHQAGESLRGLKPCWMMPPGTVAALLPREIVEQFDLVIIDEASQMPPERAFGLISRASQCVVVGDPKQLPPTSFFQHTPSLNRADLDSDVDTEVLEEESILDLCLKTFQPVRRLKWHYRSRHGSLIAFSNKQFYGNELIVFPSCDREFAIRRHFVSESRYKRGVNLPEVARVCAVVLDQLGRYPKRSLGVVAMNDDQATAIAGQLEKLSVHHKELRQHLDDRNASEQLFVKALEKVQGDERDTIIISTTYGPKETDGAVSLSMGPIKDSGGQRRLNVLFTRAKKAIELVTSIESHQIQPRPTSKEGIYALRDYLKYVETQSLDSVVHTSREPESPMEQVVAEALQSHGFTVDCRVGVANYFIDLAVRNPEKPDTYLLAIEGDGPTYHSARAARDRDKYRQAVLEGLGWQVAPIWSADWSENPDVEIKKLLKRLTQSQSKYNSERMSNTNVNSVADLALPSLFYTGLNLADGSADDSSTSNDTFHDNINIEHGPIEEPTQNAYLIQSANQLEPNPTYIEQANVKTGNEDEISIITDACDEHLVEEAVWDSLDDPDFHWIAELDWRVHLGYDERTAVISQIANSDRSVGDWIEELLHHQDESQESAGLLLDTSLDHLLADISDPEDYIVTDLASISNAGIDANPSFDAQEFEAELVIPDRNSCTPIFFESFKDSDKDTIITQQIIEDDSIVDGFDDLLELKDTRNVNHLTQLQQATKDIRIGTGSSSQIFNGTLYDTNNTQAQQLGTRSMSPITTVTSGASIIDHNQIPQKGRLSPAGIVQFADDLSKLCHEYNASVDFWRWEGDRPCGLYKLKFMPKCSLRRGIFGISFSKTNLVNLTQANWTFSVSEVPKFWHRLEEVFFEKMLCMGFESSDTPL
jgi:very-short-patch-repair endonuclease